MVWNPGQLSALGQAVVHVYVLVTDSVLVIKTQNLLVDASKIQFSVVPVKEKELVSADADSTNYTYATLKPAEFERVLIALIHCAYLVQCSFKKLQMKQCF